MNIVDKISELIDGKCGYCEKPLPESSPSGDFCREACQAAWHAQRSFTRKAWPGVDPGIVVMRDEAALPLVQYPSLAGFAYHNDGQRFRAYQVDEIFGPLARIVQIRQDFLASFPAELEWNV